MTERDRSTALRAPRFDVHTHFFPAGLPDFAATTGDSRWPSLVVGEGDQGRIMRGHEVFRPVASTCWNLARRIEAMDASGIDCQVLSPVPVTLTTWADPTVADEFARTHNDAFAAAVSSVPGDRFRWMGTVALQDPTRAVTELVRGVSDLGMVGVEIGTEVGGVELDDSRFAEFFSEVEALDVPVFIHPTQGATAIRREGIPYEFGLGMLTDTATAVTALVFGGVLERHPRLRVGLSHGCGTFPAAYPRLVRGASLQPGAETVEQLSMRTSGLVKRLWTDTLVFDPHHLPLLIERFGADHLMLGSDFPFYPPSFGDPQATIAAAVDCGHCLADVGDAMYGRNAQRFLGLEGSL